MGGKSKAMKTQIIEDRNGMPTGVFIPIEDWENIKRKYPEIDKWTLTRMSFGILF